MEGSLCSAFAVESLPAPEVRGYPVSPPRRGPPLGVQGYPISPPEGPRRGQGYPISPPGVGAPPGGQGYPISPPAGSRGAQGYPISPRRIGALPGAQGYPISPELGGLQGQGYPIAGSPLLSRGGVSGLSHRPAPLHPLCREASGLSPRLARREVVALVLFAYIKRSTSTTAVLLHVLVKSLLNIN